MTGEPAAGAQQWIAIAATTELAPGGMIGTRAAGYSIVVYNVGGDYYATSNVCTHEFAHLSDGWLDGPVIECPLHGGQFDVRTGKGRGPPITCDLRTFPVRVVGDRVEVLLGPIPRQSG